jgi:hypothetical protein
MQMKNKWMILATASVLTCGLAMAQQEAEKNVDPAAPPPIPPIPPKVPGEEL